MVPSFLLYTLVIYLERTPALRLMLDKVGCRRAIRDHTFEMNASQSIREIIYDLFSLPKALRVVKMSWAILLRVKLLVSMINWNELNGGR